jgi:tryptophanyl-tRNA synthetase
MTQFKDKSSKSYIDTSTGTFVGDIKTFFGGVSVGLFNYPVLMAADILLYGATYVPVGDDQTQHLEFTRDIAMRLNNKFGNLLTVPLAVSKQHEFFGKDQGLRIKDLVDPSKKMSKSDETGKGVIFLSDSPEVATKKIMSATTDSFGEIRFDMKERPGISNLLQILALLSGRDQKEVIAKWEGQTRYGDLKKAVAEAVAEFLTTFQSQLQQVNNDAILQKLESSEHAMSEQANATLLRVQKAVGLR